LPAIEWREKIAPVERSTPVTEQKTPLLPFTQATARAKVRKRGAT
jgi:hypothetical protein